LAYHSWILAVKVLLLVTPAATQDLSFTFIWMTGPHNVFANIVKQNVIRKFFTIPFSSGELSSQQTDKQKYYQKNLFGF
jgi:hypothetical protein